MCASVEDGGSAYLKGGSVLRNDQLDIVIALKNLVNAVMKESDTDYALARAYHLGWAGTGLGVLGNVLVQDLEILHGLVMSLHLNHGVDEQFCRAGRVGVGQHDESLVLFLGQVIPCLGRLQAQAVQFFRIFPPVVASVVLMVKHVAQLA